MKIVDNLSLAKIEITRMDEKLHHLVENRDSSFFISFLLLDA